MDLSFMTNEWITQYAAKAASDNFHIFIIIAILSIICILLTIAAICYNVKVGEVEQKMYFRLIIILGIIFSIILIILAIASWISYYNWSNYPIITMQETLFRNIIK